MTYLTTFARIKNVRCISVIALIAAFSAASAYIPVMLHSELLPGHSSAAVGIGDGQQVGSSNPINPNPRALLWNGTSKSVVDLTPAGYTTSLATAVHGGRQFGSALHPGLGQVHPIIWNGSAASYENLFAPSLGGHNFFANYMEGAGGDQQVGTAVRLQVNDPLDMAILWHGTASSAVLLHPEHMFESIAYDTDGLQQVGLGRSSSLGWRALLWHGTAQSVVDLTPAGAGTSVARGVAAGQQVGAVTIAGESVGGMWFGTASSFTVLTPAGHRGFARATNGTRQAGDYRGPWTGGMSHAAVWSGSAESIIDLHQFLPAEWGAHFSTAWGIDEAGNIAGMIQTMEGERAVMWVVPEPGTIAALAAGIGLLLPRRRRRNSGCRR